VAERVPQLALMNHVDAVISHGGHNTVCEALAHGLPLVVTPIRDDQPIIAQQVVSAGAGVRLKYTRVRAGEIRTALDSVLHTPDYAANARRVQESFRAAGGASAAADHLEAVAA
jgi:UDP:flavonoid glycosyltransferase YjiC (YdhE family)